MLKEKVRQLPDLFPDEYKVVEESDSLLILLILPGSEMTAGIPNDLLISICPLGNGVKYIATNEGGKIKSYNEHDRNEKALKTTIELIDKAINNSLYSAQKQVAFENEQAKKKVHPIIQLSLYIVVIILSITIVNLKGCWF